jgi:peptidyl-prolyl cis-trans isomerase C
MYKFICSLCPVLFSMVVLVGCSQSSDAPDTRVIQLPATTQIAETVNGTPVPQALLEAVARERNLPLDKPVQRDQALKLVADFVLLAQAAQRENFSAQSPFQAQVEAARLTGVAAAVMSELQKQTPIDDAILKAQYDAEIARAGKLEYDFSQLLFANPDDALKAEGDILAGKPFAQVFDAWRGKAKQAKTFSRVRLDQVPEALGKALAGMQNGESTKVPVKTDFGWHVLHLDIANPFTPPAFDQVKEGIRRSILVKIGQERLAKLREQAKIEYPPGTAPVVAAPAANTPPPVEEKPAAEKKD